MHTQTCTHTHAHTHKHTHTHKHKHTHTHTHTQITCNALQVGQPQLQSSLTPRRRPPTHASRPNQAHLLHAAVLTGWGTFMLLQPAVLTGWGIFISLQPAVFVRVFLYNSIEKTLLLRNSQGCLSGHVQDWPKSAYTYTLTHIHAHRHTCTHNTHKKYRECMTPMLVD